MFGELEQFLTLHCRTENHHKVLDCLLEVRNKPGDYPRPTPRNRPSANAGFQGESSKMEKERSIGGNVTSSGYRSFSGHPGLATVTQFSPVGYLSVSVNQANRHLNCVLVSQYFLKQSARRG